MTLSDGNVASPHEVVMRAFSFLLLLAGCAVQPGAPSHPSDEGYVIEGELPEGVDLDEVLEDLPPGGFAVVADPGTGQTATIASTTSPAARVASGEFSVAVAASCADCGDPSCASTLRTIEIGLLHELGTEGEPLAVQTVQTRNFAAPEATPASWTAKVGTVTHLSTTGSLPACAPFAHYFDVVAPDALPWSHTVTLDGSLGDWLPDESFETSQGAGTRNLVTWDSDHLYIGSDHPDVQTGGPLHWLVVTVGNGDPGSTVGTQLNNQVPGLPFEATHVLRWKADNSYRDILAWDGSGWAVVGSPQVAEDNGRGSVELAVPLADLGITDGVQVHVNWVYEGGGSESSYAATPAGSFPQGAFDPDYGQYLSFDLTSPDAPATSTPLP